MEPLPLGGATIPTTISPIDGSSKVNARQMVVLRRAMAMPGYSVPVDGLNRA